MASTLDGKNIPSFKDFMKAKAAEKMSDDAAETISDYTQTMETLEKRIEMRSSKSYFIETYGCQMNVSDSEVSSRFLDYKLLITSCISHHNIFLNFLLFRKFLVIFRSWNQYYWRLDIKQLHQVLMLILCC